MKPFRLTLVAVLTLLANARAQQFSISWYTIDGGGGGSQSRSCAVTGTIGQPDASYYTMSSGRFSVTGGFWSIFAVQTPGAPTLKIRLTETNTAIVSWPNSPAGYTLRQNLTLLAPDWVAPLEAVNDDGTTKYIIVNPQAGNRYYRLIKP
jgi:hypothetical protein